MAAVLSLGRPGAIEFVDNFAEFTETGKNQSIHKDFDAVLKDTAGCPIFQEDLMRIAHEVFGLSLEQAELLRRAVGKKSHKEMAKFESILQERGEKLGKQESAKKFWEMLNASADYAFNKCLSADTVVETKNGFKMLYEIQKGESVMSFNPNTNMDEYVTVLDKHENQAELYEVELDDKRTITCSMNHKLMCSDYKMRPLSVILEEKWGVLTD